MVRQLRCIIKYRRCWPSLSWWMPSSRLLFLLVIITLTSNKKNVILNNVSIIRVLTYEIWCIQLELFQNKYFETWYVISSTAMSICTRDEKIKNLKSLNSRKWNPEGIIHCLTSETYNYEKLKSMNTRIIQKMTLQVRITVRSS